MVLGKVEPDMNQVVVTKEDEDVPAEGIVIQKPTNIKEPMVGI